KVRIRGDEFDLVFIFQVVDDSFEQTFFSAADFMAAVTRPLSGSFQRSHFYSYLCHRGTETQRRRDRETESKSGAAAPQSLRPSLSLCLCGSVASHSGDSLERLSQYCCS